MSAFGEKISKDEFLKKYFGNKEFNQELEFKDVVGHFLVIKKGGEPFSIVYVGHQFTFSFTIKKKEFKDFYYAHSDRRDKLAVLHQPFVAAHDVKNGVLNFYSFEDKSKNENYGTYGIYKGKPLNLTRLIFRKGKIVHSFDIENGRYSKREVVGSSFQELNKEKTYQFVQKIYQGTSKSGGWPLADSTSLKDVFSSEYDATSKLLIAVKEKRKLKADKQTFDLYSKREKTLAEQVLNYTTSGNPEGEKSNYWYALKGKKCTLQPVGSADWLGKNKTPFNVRKLNQTAFRIYPETISAYGLHSNVFNVETAKKVYFNPGQYLVDFDRLRNAWVLLFEQCPGKRSKF